jgi:hypothetical protein
VTKHGPVMATIRIFAEDDLPAVAALYGRVYPDLRWPSPSACESSFREVFFRNPWRELELPSWVAEENGRVTGFVGVLPRPMRLCGRPIRVAVGVHFMVDPDERHSLTALQLVKACFSGPQDLYLADAAIDRSRHLWTKLGGTASLLHSLQWIWTLRPGRFLLSVLHGRDAVPAALMLAARPLGAAADALAAKLLPNRFLREDTELAEDALDPHAMLAHLPEVLDGNALQPVYDAHSLAWLLEQAAGITRHGTLRGRAVLDAERRLIGWYLYYLRAGGLSDVIQIASRNGSFDRVLQRLLADAWRQGAAALRGRLDPRHVQEFSDPRCWLRTGGAWTLVHSRHADILAAIRQGDAFLSRLEGECCVIGNWSGGAKPLFQA